MSSAYKLSATRLPVASQPGYKTPISHHIFNGNYHAGCHCQRYGNQRREHFGN